jgi:hypothetical protein
MFFSLCGDECSAFATVSLGRYDAYDEGVLVQVLSA